MNGEDKIMQYERDRLIKKHKTMSKKTSKVIVVKRNGYLQLETECGIVLAPQIELTIKNGVTDTGYVTVSADFEIPIDEFKIHEKDKDFIEFKIDAKSIIDTIERSKPIRSEDLSIPKEHHCITAHKV